jgi:hypothetical protein
MKLQAVRNAVTSKVGRQILTAQKHSPTILFVGGVVGVVASTVMACRATLEVEALLDEADHDRQRANTLVHRDYSERDRVQDHTKIKIRTTGKIVRLYAPAATVGAISIAALSGSHVILTKRNAAVMAAYSALDKGFKDYRQRVREELGDDKDSQFRYGSEARTVVEETDKGSTTRKIEGLPEGWEPSIYARVFDQQSQSWDPHPEYNLAFVNAQQNHFNNKLRANGHVFLNEVYDAFGLRRSKEGAVVGWVLSKGGDNYIDFGVFDERYDGARAYIRGYENAILLDFNVDGVIWDKI